MIPNDANTYLPGTIQIPSSLTITDISKSYPMIVTFTINTVTEANTYRSKQVVRLTVPITYGMYQANGLEASILDVGSSTMTLDVDSRLFDTFSIPAAGQIQPATLAPSGSRNLQFDNTTRQVPFQSLNNIGN
jgi:hypothetical protein